MKNRSSRPIRSLQPRRPHFAPTLRLRPALPKSDGKGKRGSTGGDGDGVCISTDAVWLGLGPLTDVSPDPTPPNPNPNPPRRYDVYLDRRLVYRAVPDAAIPELWAYYAPHLGHALTSIDLVAANPSPPAVLR